MSLAIRAGVKLVAFCLVGVGTPSFAHDNGCADIEGSLERLNCYDESHASSETSLSPADAIQQLRDLVEYYDPSERFEILTGPGECQITTDFIRMKPRGQWTDVVHLVSQVDLSKVERLGGWKKFNPVVTFPKSVFLITERGSSGSWSRRGHTYTQQVRFSVDDIDTEPFKVIEEYRGRDARFFLLVEPFGPDQNKVEAALKNAIAACRN